MARSDADPRAGRHADLAQPAERPPDLRRHLQSRPHRAGSRRAAAPLRPDAACRVSQQLDVDDRAELERVSQRRLHHHERARHDSHRVHRRFVDLRDERQSGSDVSGPPRGAAPRAASRRAVRGIELRRPRVLVIPRTATARDARERAEARHPRDWVRDERL